jgi:hypothetical protein
MTCRCKAQFCYICGAVWDPAVGCPNFCNGEEEMERRRLEEEARAAEQEAEKAAREAAAALEAAEKVEAERRTKASPEFDRLRADMAEELERFRSFERKAKCLMWSRHASRKLATVDKYTDQIEKTKERHAKTAAHLEDRQIAAEMELRATLEQSERSVKIRLRHMEAYCHGLGRNPDLTAPPAPGVATATGLPGRVVTERDLRELGQQYNLRDGMERLHQAKINVMRDRQAKRMEELLERQDRELERLVERREAEVETVAGEFAAEEDALARAFSERRRLVTRKWELDVERTRRELEDKLGARFAPIEVPGWPDENEAVDEGLTAVPE